MTPDPNNAEAPPAPRSMVFPGIPECTSTSPQDNTIKCLRAEGHPGDHYTWEGPVW